MSVTWNNSAYAKLFLHATKYPNSFVCGFMIGDGTGNIVDCVPVSHSAPVGPIFDIAADLTDAILPASKSIVGVYFGNERSNDISTPVFVEKICAGIKERTNNCLKVRIDTPSMAIKSMLCVNAWRDGKMVSSNPSPSSSVASMNAAVDSLLSCSSSNNSSTSKGNSSYVQQFADIQDYLDYQANNGPVVDFRNEHIIELC